MLVTNNTWLKLKNIDVVKDNKLILSKINIELKEEEVITILGPNGSGKSTFIKLISREIYPVFNDYSTIEIFGKKNINIWELRSKISFLNIELDKRINRNMSVEEVICSALYGTIGFNINHYRNKNVEKAIKHISDIFEFTEEFISANYSNLSDGQKRVVLLARAVVNKPKILILDEPTINLDIKEVLRLFNIVEQLIKKGITLVVVTNNLETIIKDTTRIMLFKQGRLIDQGDSNSILTTDKINKLFDTNIKLFKHNGYWRSMPN
ncbi:ABC transporter ATP-binding protein [Prochlorococcus sp. MIT 1223]|uniref:ABC transporter ATP-binding protein n=1 Tax=Prochlorococcus sp. MIT 1223 TaxID=3096217 RepID=UPI002A749CCA|nr:ATP-binding cassette domain-containing protein [Prochlorococcus sp. MIT 1223]